MHALINSQLDTKLHLLTIWLRQDNERKLSRRKLKYWTCKFTVYEKNSSTSSKPTFFLRLCFVIISAAAALLNFITQNEKL